jgi:hypothetical protein
MRLRLHLSARLDHCLMLFLAATGLSLLAGPQFLSACQKLLAAHSERAFCIAAPILASVCSMDAVFFQTSDEYYIIKKTLCILFADMQCDFQLTCNFFKLNAEQFLYLQNNVSSPQSKNK